MRLIGLPLIMAGALYAQVDVANIDQGFDKPLKMSVVDLGPSPHPMPSRHFRNKLRCYYYPTFTVKEYYTRRKGRRMVISCSFSSSRVYVEARGRRKGLHQVEWIFLGW